MPTPKQARMACSGLGWTWDDLSRGASISRDTLARFMRGAASAATVEAIRTALQAAGAEFIPNGVRLVKPKWRQKA